jgi:ABC-type transport system involved in multi-copper enzyme maturation permease subunit
MLWHKVWLETRSRFAIALALLVVMAVAAVFEYPAVSRLISHGGVRVDPNGALGRVVADALSIEKDFRGFIWVQWHRQNLTQMWTLFAAILGSGGLLPRGTASGVLFTMSLPVSRQRLIAVRAAAGLAELLILATLPTLFIVLLSPLIGESYRVIDVLVYGICLFLGGAVFYSLALLLSTVFDDFWRPLLLACSLAFALGLGALVLNDLPPFSVFQVMSAESYFRSGQVPWFGLFVSSALSVGLLYGAAASFEQRDF